VSFAWYPLVNGLLMGALLAQLLVSLRRWRMACRREDKLMGVIGAFISRDQAIEEGECEEEDQLAIAAAFVAVADECHNQTRVRFYSRVPHVGKPWPHFEPAPLLGEEVEE